MNNYKTNWKLDIYRVQEHIHTKSLTEQGAFFWYV